MPAAYQIPPWLSNTPDVAGKFLSGVQIGASIGEARNRLAQQQQQAAMEAQTKQDQITASALKEAQEVQVQKAYNDAQIGLKQQQLKTLDEKVGLETVKAARQFQAQQQYQKDFQTGISTGLSEDEAARGAMFRNLAMFGTGANSGAAAMRAVTQRQAQAPTFMKGPNGEDIAVNPGTGHFQVMRAPASVMDAAEFQASPLTDTSGQRIPGKFTVPGPNGTRRVITTSTKNPNADQIKALEGGSWGFWLTEGKEPANLPKEKQAQWEQVKQQYQTLKAGGSTSEPSAAPAESTERIKVRSPDGATGTIPKSQLDEALDAGYEQVE